VLELVELAGLAYQKTRLIDTAKMASEKQTSEKSALINKLAGASRESKNQLFTSLDSQSHVVVLPYGKKAVLVDTIGFISELPNISFTQSPKELFYSQPARNRPN